MRVNSYTGAAFLDLAKAFDTVDHAIFRHEYIMPDNFCGKKNQNYSGIIR